MPRQKPKPTSARERLLRLLQMADVSSMGNLTEWISKDLNKSGLRSEWDSFRKSRVNCDPIQLVRGPAAQDYFIVIVEQHRFLKAEIGRYRQRSDQRFYDETQGLGYLPVDLALAKDEVTRAGITAEIEKRRDEFWRRKSAKFRKAVRQAQDRKRSCSPTRVGYCSWGRPMPIFCEREPAGYCQATGRHRKEVAAFLKLLDAKPVASLPKSGRGRRLNLYGVETNLLVLNHWLGKWLPQDPNTIADAIIGTVFWQATEGYDASIVRAFRRIVLPHWQRVKSSITGNNKIQNTEVRLVDYALRDDCGWLRFSEAAQDSRRRAEAASLS